MLLLYQFPFTEYLHLILKIVYTDTKWTDSNERIIEVTYRRSESVTYGIVSMVSMNTSLYIAKSFTG